MFQKFLLRTVGVLLIAQTIFMFVANHSSVSLLHQILVIQAIIFLLIAPWILKQHWLISIALTVIAIGILLSEYFPSFKRYYTFIIFIPLVVGIIVLISTNIGKSKKSSEGKK